MSLRNEVKTLQFLSLGSNTGDIITLQSSVSVELCRVLFGLFGLFGPFGLFGLFGECGKSFVSGLRESLCGWS